LHINVVKSKICRIKAKSTAFLSQSFFLWNNEVENRISILLILYWAVQYYWISFMLIQLDTYIFLTLQSYQTIAYTYDLEIHSNKLIIFLSIGTYMFSNIVYKIELNSSIILLNLKGMLDF
jgi:glutamine cyclotransferase